MVAFALVHRRITMLALLLATVTFAGPLARQKAMSKRAEAQELVEQLLRGEGNQNIIVNRIKYLGEEPYACAELSDLARREFDAERMRTVASTLGQLGHPCAEGTLMNLLGSDDGATRMAAAQGLGRMKSLSAGPKLQALLEDKSMGVRKEAARALGATRALRFGGPLMKVAKTEGEPEVRVEMLIAVGNSGDKKQSAALEAFLTNSSESTRFAAAKGLCLLGSKKGFDFARARLAATDRWERMQGLALFEGSRAKDVNVVLAPLLDDADHGLAASAARVLYQGGDESKLSWLVLRSFHADGPDKLLYEEQIEPLRLADDQRKAILAKAGIQ